MHTLYRLPLFLYGYLSLGHTMRHAVLAAGEPHMWLTSKIAAKLWSAVWSEERLLRRISRMAVTTRSSSRKGTRNMSTLAATHSSESEESPCKPVATVSVSIHTCS